MADRPLQPMDSIPERPSFTGGWHRPPERGAWRPPVRRADEGDGGWRVPTLPQDLEVEPESQGAWHLPRPEDTIFTAEDEIEVAPERVEAAPTRPEDMLFDLETPAANGESTPAAVDSSDVLAEEEPAADEETSSLLALEEAAQDAPDLEEIEDDEGAFSMSELLALSSLVEQTPAPSIVPTQREEDGAQAPASEGTSPADASDPAAYARRQVEMLGGTAAEAPAPAATGAQAPAATTGADDPAAYARRQVEMLGGTAAQPAGAAAGLTPEQQDLARRFRETEERVRDLRARYQAGEISREDLQTQLRQLMILDENRTWWMMGVETDTWYRFDNGDWVVATPPYLTTQVEAPGRVSPPTVTSNLNPVDVLQGGSLPYFPSQPVQPEQEFPLSDTFGTPSDTGGMSATEEMPLPRNVPIQDPDRTQVGTVGAYLQPVRPDAAETIPGMGRVEDTVVNPRVQFDAAEGIPSPLPSYETGMETAPEYNIAQDAPVAEGVEARERAHMVSNVLRLALVGVGLVLLLAACGIGYVVLQYNSIASQWQAEIDSLANYQPPFQTVTILDMNGNQIAEINSQQGGARRDVPLSRISPYMIHAVVSLENQRFFEDPGWDWIAIGRAFLQNLSAGQVESGASTITQQIAEQLILQRATTTPDLKIQEIVIASGIAQQYSKEEILELYLNEIYFGNQSYGVEAASQFYFGHSAAELNLPESALLAAMIAAPAQYNPVRVPGEDNPTYSVRREQTLNRMDEVMQRMVQVGCLPIPGTGQPEFCVDQSDLRDAVVQTAQVKATRFEPREVRFRYPHFVFFVQAQLERWFGAGEMFRRGFIVRTTLNPSVQDAAENELDQQMAALVATGVNTGSVMVTDPRTGAIRAMVGSPDFNNEDIEGQVNGALTWQQPGSAIKPIVYTAALEGVDRNGDGVLEYMTPATILWDVPTTFQNPPYTPVNFDGQFVGPIPFRFALQNSRNVPSVKVFEFVGVEKFRDVAQRMGLNFPQDAQFGLATGLGAVEVTLYDMMQAYGTLANDGVRLPLYAIESITDASGAPVLLPERGAPAQAIQPQVAYLMQNILSDDNARADEFGLNGPLTLPNILPTTNYVAAKTGTTNQNRDLWTMGFTSNMVVGVWLGRPDNNPTFVQGGGYQNVAPLWQAVMRAALNAAGRPEPFLPPTNGSVVEIQICADTGTIVEPGAAPPPNCRSLRTEVFLQNQPPPPSTQAFVQQVSIDTWTGLRANQYCPRNTITGTFVNINDPAAVAWLRTAEGRAVAQRLGLTGDTLDSVPSGACDVNTENPIADIVFPSDNSTVSGVVQVTGAATAPSFNRYQLEVASAAAPNSFTIVDGPVTTPVTSGPLGTWNTASFPNGTYTLRLAMFSTTGGYLYRTVRVNIANVTPTPPPVPTTPPTLFVPATSAFQEVTAAPLPFEEVTQPAP